MVGAQVAQRSGSYGGVASGGGAEHGELLVGGFEQGSGVIPF